MGFEFEIQYRMVVSNWLADALSRKGLDAEMHNMEVGCWNHWNKLREEMARDEFISRVKKELEVYCSSHQGFSVYQGNIYYKNSLVITAKSPVIQEVMAEFHNSQVGGHAGERKTYQRAVAEVYWQGMIKDIIVYCTLKNIRCVNNTSP
ncbi:hypothetical protein Lser_V15G15376 [Lactuca serriola]